MLQSILAAGSLPAYGSLADPPVASVLTAAVAWLEGTVLGSVATSAAVIATACAGLMMLSGRLGVRPGLTVILGSFVLFGASTIASGIRGAQGDPVPPAPTIAEPPATTALPSPPRPPPPLPPAAPADPFAGASVPTR